MKKLLILNTLLVMTIALHAQSLPIVKPEKVGMISSRLNRAEAVIQQAIAAKEIPGAVLLVARHGKIVHRKAYGSSQLIPAIREMQVDMIFDLASITKPVATATSIMILVEQGKIRLWEKVKDFIPEFSVFIDSTGKKSEDARIWHLLTHTSGLAPYTDAKEIESTYGAPCPLDSIAVFIARKKKIAAPGKEFHYSCLGYITLANILKRVTGQTIAEFSVDQIYKPLGMAHTCFKPSPEWLNQCVPTEVIAGKPLLGVVHDPLARLQDGISGNAGLFSTVDDLAIFAQMMLQQGEFRNVRVLSPLTVDRMISVFPEVQFAGRGLGWDLHSPYATNGGDIFSKNSYGHSGYTGTSIWIDPDSQTSVILLTNRVHPDDKGSVVSLRSKVANIIASAICK